MKKIFTCLWFFLFSIVAINVDASTAKRGSKDTKSFTYEDLVSLIQTKDLRNLEEVLPFFPREMLSNFTLMHNSMSLQPADPLHPRVIMFGVDAKLTCTFVENEKVEAHDTLECFQFRDKTRSFDFREIVFPSSMNHLTEVVFSESNKRALTDTSCLSCHGSDPRPNWEPYSTWPGAYGSLDDEIFVKQTHDVSPASIKEGEDYLKFKAGLKNTKRYSQLLFGSNTFAPYSSDFKKLDLNFRPNFHLLIALSQLVAQRNARLLERQPVSDQLEFLNASLGCSPPSARVSFLKKHFSEFDWMPAFRSLDKNCKDCGEIINDLRSFNYLTGFQELDALTGYVLLEDLVSKGKLPSSALRALSTSQYQTYGDEPFNFRNFKLMPALKSDNSLDNDCDTLTKKRVPSPYYHN